MYAVSGYFDAGDRAERSVDNILKASLPKLREKLLEALQAVLPIVAIVLVLCFTIAPISPSILLCFLLGAAMIIVGIMFFTLGAEMSMSPMGERMGTMLTKTRSLPLIIGVGFLLGFLITISEPDLQVLANQVPSIPNMTLILSVAAGVGLFLVMAFLRMLFGIPLPRLLVLFYSIIFILAAFVPKEFLAVAFDSGGVTTGPMTVPFIMALGVGVAAIRSDRHAADDSFGLVALCSVGTGHRPLSGSFRSARRRGGARPGLPARRSGPRRGCGGHPDQYTAGARGDVPAGTGDAAAGRG